jgi:hypothetical protein
MIPTFNIRMEEIASTIEVMRLQEASYHRRDYFSSRPTTSRLKRPQVGTTGAVDAECRFKMAEWYYQVVDFCKFDRETVAISMSYLDRYMSTQVGVVGSSSSIPAFQDRKIFQLIAMTCLYTAIKIHEPQAMEPQTVVQLSKGAFTEEQVTDMELAILNAIQWRMNPPTAISFIKHFLALLPETMMGSGDRDTVYELAKFQTELAALEYSLVVLDASTVALAAMMNALETVACDKSMLDIKAMLTKVSSHDMDSSLISESRDKLAQLLIGDSVTGPCVSRLKPKSYPGSKRFVSPRGSVHVSPRGVVSS